jgi:transcriptional regulator GlxA family with amidase domain
MQAKIAELFVAEAVRAWLLDAERAGLVLRGELTDDALSDAIDTIRQRFHEQWSVGLLAKHVGLSRTALATRFRLLTGDSPMHCLRRVRLSHAASLLATTRLSQAHIAHLTGYANEAALAKAFKRERGETLGRHRSAARALPPLQLAELTIT